MGYPLANLCDLFVTEKERERLGFQSLSGLTVCDIDSGFLQSIVLTNLAQRIEREFNVIVYND